MSILSRLRKPLTADALLLKKYRLSPAERALLIAWGLVLAQLAAPIGSAIYYLGTQVTYFSQAKHGALQPLVGSKEPGDWWDRLPVHIDNALGVDWFGSHDVVPAWWVIARHDFRHVLIGFLIALLTGSVTVGLKRYMRRTTWQMIVSVPLALIVALLTATGLILFFNHFADSVNSWGTSAGTPYVSDWVGSGALFVTVIGIVSGLVAKRFVLAPTFATIQLLSLEDRIAEERKVPKWFPPNYQRRHDYLVASGHEPKSHGKYMGVFLATAAPFVFALAAYGTWLLHWGPASH